MLAVVCYCCSQPNKQTNSNKQRTNTHIKKACLVGGLLCCVVFLCVLMLFDCLLFCRVFVCVCLFFWGGGVDVLMFRLFWGGSVAVLMFRMFVCCCCVRFVCL